MKRLPIGIQTFSEIVNGGYLYIDKTEGIAQLLNSGKYFFFSRPRRFGKSLLLSTIKAIMTGSRDLFKGLWIYDQWDWSRQHPVIHISFASLGYKEGGLSEAIVQELDRIATGFEVNLEPDEPGQMLRELIGKLKEIRGKVVILIDEYDKPIIDYLGKDTDKAKEHQRVMRSFYSVIKDADPFIEFFLITGISKFSKVSLFSDLNNLYDLSIDQNYSTLLGYTQEELEAYFSSYFPKVMQRKNITSREEFLQQVRLWYNGYSWDGQHFVYNPFSILSFFQNGDFYNFWFESGTPSFLLELMKSQNFYKVEGLEVDALTFAGYDIEHLQSLPVLFQTGYLTIKSRTDLGLYVLDYPNKEVRDAMYGHILGDLRNDQPGFSAVFMVELRKAFYANDIETVIDVIKSLFARIPYEIFIAKQEAYYHSLLYIAFQFLGSYIVETEVSTNRGRIDAVVHTPTDIYVIEFKLDEPAEAALAQIRQKKYYEKYTHSGKPIHLLGIGFSSEAKSVADWKEERV